MHWQKISELQTLVRSEVGVIQRAIPQWLRVPELLLARIRVRQWCLTMTNLWAQNGSGASYSVSRRS
jgi:hypothetical protein